MPILSITKSDLQRDLEAKDAGVVASISDVHRAAATIRGENAKFWRLPTDRLLAVLNADVAITLETFSKNTAAATALNAIIDSAGLPQFPGRAPTTMGRRDIAFDGTQFIQTPLPDDGLDEFGNPLPETQTEPAGAALVV